MFNFFKKAITNADEPIVEVELPQPIVNKPKVKLTTMFGIKQWLDKYFERTTPRGDGFWYMLKPAPKDFILYLNGGGPDWEVGEYHTKPDRRTFLQKLTRKVRKEWEYAFLLDWESSGRGYKVLVEKGTLYCKEPWGLSAVKIKILEVVK